VAPHLSELDAIWIIIQLNLNDKTTMYIIIKKQKQKAEKKK